MKKTLKTVGILTGVISIISLTGLGCIYIKDVAANLIVVKRRVFPKNKD